MNEDRMLREETMETDLVTAVNHLLMTEAIHRKHQFKTQKVG